MSIALLISEQRDAAHLLPWAIRLARVRGQSLLLIHVIRQGSQEQRTVAQPDHAGNWGEYADSVAGLNDAGLRWDSASSTEATDDNTPVDDALTFRIVCLLHPHTAKAVSQELAGSRVSALFLRRDAHDHGHVLDRSTLDDLISNVTCELIQLHPGAKNVDDCRSIMVPMGASAHSSTALVLASELSENTQATVSAVYVEPNVDEYAQQVGQRILDRQVRKTLGGRDDIKRRIVIDNKVNHGIRSILGEYDAVVLGIRHRGKMRRWLMRALAEDLLAMDDGPTVIAVRPATPLTGRVAQSIDRLLRNGIPQLERTQRIAVVERIQSSSNWDFDFIALVCLATLIAAGGLIQNSAAVVIGAMLVAPLMTPLLGAGLSLVQGNLILLRNTAQSVLRGFFLAVTLSLIVGWCAHGLQVTNEMAARGAPRILDLLVAFISGIAAAYAIGRPNLLSALPGVAIAAALVPPIATLGLGLSLGEWRLAAGAALLFLTNIVAIVLGTACSFLAVGIRGSHSHGAFRFRSLRVAIGLVVLLLGLGIYESIPKDQGPTVNSELELFLQEHDAELISMVWTQRGERNVVRLVVECRQAIDRGLSTEVARMLSVGQKEGLLVEVETRLVTVVGP